ncbi:MAG: hypothetical protein NTW25_08495 [Candidatus Kapabacteria bacterium]|nr:hypothetical protein [Candidatus Kapabacteria bacterium]
MKNEENELIQKLNNIISKPGGGQAARFLLNIFGILPVIGSLISSSSNLWSEKEQEEVNKLILEFIKQSDDNFNLIFKKLELESIETSKSNMILFFQEVLNYNLPLSFNEYSNRNLSVVLNSDTINEFKRFEQKGWISMQSIGNTTNMGANNSFGNSIEDKKRPWGMGSGFNIVINKSFYDV